MSFLLFSFLFRVPAFGCLDVCLLFRVFLLLYVVVVVVVVDACCMLYIVVYVDE